MKRVLITGVTGFIGSGLVRHFCNMPDYPVIGHSRDMTKARKQFQHDKIEIVGDYSAGTLNNLEIDYVIHLAGIAHDLSRQYRPEDYYRVNFEETKLVYDEFLKSNASKFVFVSSIKAVVDIAIDIVTEDVTPYPATDYGKSKLKTERYIQSRPGTPGKHFYILRPCMIHGPGNKGNLNLLYRFVRMGVPFPLGAFDNQRSFLGIDNFIFIVQQLFEKEIASGVFHLADDGFLSTKELFSIMANALGKRGRVWNIPESWIRFGAGILGKQHVLNKLTEDMMVSNKKIMDELGSALPFGLREGIIKTVRSFDE